VRFHEDIAEGDCVTQGGGPGGLVLGALENIRSLRLEVRIINTKITASTDNLKNGKAAG
jgi:hypothetical protein